MYLFSKKKLQAKKSKKNVKAMQRTLMPKRPKVNIETEYVTLSS